MQITDDIMALADEMNLGAEARRGAVLVLAIIGRYNLTREKLQDDLRASNNELLERARAAEQAPGILAQLMWPEIDALAMCAGKPQPAVATVDLTATIEALIDRGLINSPELLPTVLGRAVLNCRDAILAGKGPSLQIVKGAAP